MAIRKMKTDAMRNARNSARLEEQAETAAKWLIILELTLKQQLIRFLREDQGQDLIEYTLLLGFCALASAALFIGSGAAAHTIWGVANAEMSNAAVAAS